MPGRMIRHFSLMLAILIALAPSEPARADRKPPLAEISRPPIEASSKPVTPRSSSDRVTGKGSAPSGQGGGWWMSTAGVALILALAGWGSVVGRKYLPKSVLVRTNGMKVIGRTSLSPKHSVYLLQVGERVLIVGAGPQGAPSLLGELDARDELLASASASAAPDLAQGMPKGRFDQRIGDDQP